MADGFTITPRTRRSDGATVYEVRGPDGCGYGVNIVETPQEAQAKIEELRAWHAATRRFRGND